ncbi:MAG: hypothetical protein V1678_05360 [Candidatus Aenigmatarchaeota archaeon]
MKGKNFNFKWKLIENYFNALMVITFAVLIVYGIVDDNVYYLVAAAVGAVAGPFIATFIDKKSQ